MKTNLIAKIICAFFTFCILKCNAANIVIILSCSSHSHRIVHWPIVEALLAKGHNVTYIGPIGPTPETTNPQVTELHPKSTVALTQAILNDNFDVNHRAMGIIPPLFLIIDYMCYTVCKSMMESEELQSWLESKPKVDLIISDFTSECGYGLVQKLKSKHILFGPLPLMTKHFEFFGMNAETHSIPDWDVTREVPLGFRDRFAGALLPFWYKIVTSTLFRFGYNAVFEKELGLKKPLSLDQAYELTNLIITNGDYVSDYARSFPPFVVKVPGLHLKRGEQLQKGLDKEVESFIEQGESIGVIYISFGTVAKAPMLPMELRQIFFKTIESFPRCKFIWKWDGEKPKESYPKNLLLLKWIDQQKILSHPKMLMFLTQAGRPSSQEAIDNGVPTITFPVFADQDFNAGRMVNLGSAIGLDFVDLTQEKLSSAISTILRDDSYKSRALRLSQMSRDVPLGPIETAMFWIEFVLRYTPQELALMKPLSRDLRWYEKRELDIWLVILVLFVLSLYVTFYIIRKIISKILYKPKIKKS